MNSLLTEATKREKKKSQSVLTKGSGLGTKLYRVDIMFLLNSASCRHEYNSSYSML